MVHFLVFKIITVYNINNSRLKKLILILTFDWKMLKKKSSCISLLLFFVSHVLSIISPSLAYIIFVLGCCFTSSNRCAVRLSDDLVAFIAYFS
jgi:hypothetical protein